MYRHTTNDLYAAVIFCFNLYFTQKFIILHHKYFVVVDAMKKIGTLFVQNIFDAGLLSIIFFN